MEPLPFEALPRIPDESDPWEPSPSQARRLAALVGWAQEHLPAIWDLADGRAPFWSREQTIAGKYPDQARESMRRLRTVYAADALARAVPEVLVFGAAGTRPRHQRVTGVEAVLYALASCEMSANPTSYAAALVIARLRHLIANGRFVNADGRCLSTVPHDYVESCVVWLAALRNVPEALPAIEALVLGHWDHPVERIPVADTHDERDRYPRLWTRYEAAAVRLDWNQTLLECLVSRGRLDYAGYLTLVAHMPWACRPTPDPSDAWLRDSSARPELWSQRLIWQCARTRSDQDGRHLRRAEGLVGVRFLLRACELAEELQPPTLVRLDYYGASAATEIVRLAGIVALDADDHPDDAVAVLRRFREATLALVLPHAGVAEPLVMRALGWDAAEPLRAFTSHLAGRDERIPPDICHCTSPTCGVIDAREARALVAAAGRPLTERMFAAYRAAGLMERTFTLVEAVMGWNAEILLRGLGHRRQVAMKAFGLQPLSAGAEEVYERYQIFCDLRKMAKDWGPDQRANILAAVGVGLTNLAATAGYADSTRLEWAMEARLAVESTGPRGGWTIGAYRLTLVLDERPRLEVSKAGKVLKTVPPTVRRSEAYGEARELLDESVEQLGRFRAALERAMIEGETFPTEVFTRLTDMPAFRAIVGGLVLCSAEGACGLWDPQGPSLVDRDGTRRPVGDRIGILHPAGTARSVLAGWQPHLLRSRVRQPFKQLFRETYALTAKDAAATSSPRFAGHRIVGSTAFRILVARGWRPHRGKGQPATRRWDAADVTACIGIDGGDYLGQPGCETTMGAIWFQRGVSHDRHHRWQEPPMPLADVPARVWSETLRDVDLLVSAAPSGGPRGSSAEMVEHRAELVRLLAADAGLEAVTFDGHWAVIRGMRAGYRLHLGSGVVHLEPSGTLSLVAESTGCSGLFLPFADDDDPRTASIVATLFLLADDGSITERSVLDQIAAATSAE